MASLDQHHFEFGTTRKTKALLDVVNRNPDPIIGVTHNALGKALEGQKLTIEEFVTLFEETVQQYVAKEDWDKMGIIMIRYAQMLTEDSNPHWYHNLDRYRLGIDTYQPFIPSYGKQQAKSESGTVQELDVNHLESMTVEQLKKEADKRGVSTDGLRLKKKIIEALVAPQVVS